MKEKIQRESKKYQDMLNDVEAIVHRLSNQQFDLDDMVKEIEQGYTLINQMRERLDKTKMTVEKLRAEFEDKPQFLI